MSTDQKVTVNVDLDEIREQAEKFADAGRYGPAHVLFEFLATHTPKTMAEVEWDYDEHRFAEATAAWTEGTTSEVVMLRKQGNEITVYQSAPHYTGLRELNPAILTPTGRMFKLVPEGSPAAVFHESIKEFERGEITDLPSLDEPKNVPGGEPQQGEAWLVELDLYGDGLQAVPAIRVRIDGRTQGWAIADNEEKDGIYVWWDGSVVPITSLQRLVPEKPAEPRTLTTLGDYTSATPGTIVEDNTGLQHRKENSGNWSGRTPEHMSGTPRKVIREGSPS